MALPDKKPDIPVARAMVLRADRIAERCFGAWPPLSLPPAPFASALGDRGNEVERGLALRPLPGWSKRESEPPRAAGRLFSRRLAAPAAGRSSAAA